MIKATFSRQGARVDADAVRASAAAARVDLGHHTRRINRTTATLRRGKHAKLDPEEKARRSAERRAKSDTRKREQETMVEAVRARNARRRQELEEEKNCRWKIGVRLDPEARPKVTATGGRKLERRAIRFERVTLPSTTGLSRRTGVVFRIKSRKLGTKGTARWRRGEAARFGRYLVRLSGLEASPSESVLTNIVGDYIEKGTDDFVQQLSGFLTSVEQLEEACDPEGQVYKSIIVPLPFEVGLEGRQRIAIAYADVFERRKLPFLIVLHAPDPGGNARNTHMHIMVMTRTFNRVADWEWEFGATKARDIFHPAMLAVWRRLTVAILNSELHRVRSDRRYTLRATGPVDEHRGRGAAPPVPSVAKKVRETEQRRLDHSKSIDGLTQAILLGARRLKATERATVSAFERGTRKMLTDLKAMAKATSARCTTTSQTVMDTGRQAYGRSSIVNMRHRACHRLATVKALPRRFDEIADKRVHFLKCEAEMLRVSLATILSSQRVAERTAALALASGLYAQQRRFAVASEQTERAGSYARRIRDLLALKSDARATTSRVSDAKGILDAGVRNVLTSSKVRTSDLHARLDLAANAMSKARSTAQVRFAAAEISNAAAADGLGSPTTAPVSSPIALGPTNPIERADTADTGRERSREVGTTDQPAAKKATLIAVSKPMPTTPTPPAPIDPRAYILAEKKRRERVQQAEAAANVDEAIESDGGFAKTAVETVSELGRSIGRNMGSFLKRVRTSKPSAEIVGPVAASLDPSPLVHAPTAPVHPLAIAEPGAVALEEALERFDRRVRLMPDDAREEFGIAIPLIRLAIRQRTASCWWDDDGLQFASEDKHTMALLLRFTKSPAGRAILADQHTSGRVPETWHRERLQANLVLTQADRTFGSIGDHDRTIEAIPLARRNDLVRTELDQALAAGAIGPRAYRLIEAVLDENEFRCSVLLTGTAERPVLRLSAMDADALSALADVANSQRGRAFLVRLAAHDMLGRHMPPLHWDDWARAIAPTEVQAAVLPTARYLHAGGFGAPAPEQRSQASAIDINRSQRVQREGVSEKLAEPTEVAREADASNSGELSTADKLKYLQGKGRAQGPG